MSGPQEASAIAVGSVNYGDADRILRLLSPTLGQVSVLARGARRSQRRYAGALEIGNHIHVVVRPGKGELWHLSTAKLLDGRLHVRDDLSTLSLMAYACELCGALARPLHPEPKLFGLLEMTLVLLNAVTDPPSPLFRIGLEAKALTFAGLRPSLSDCAVCGELLSGELRYSLSQGGAAHLECADGEPITAEWAAAVEGARRTPLRDLVDAPWAGGPPWVLSDQLAWHLQRPLKSRGVLEALLPPADTPPPTQ